MPKRSPAIAYLVGTFVFPVVGLLMAFLFLFVMKAAGRGGQGMDGLALVASIITFPMLALFFAVAVWIPISAYLEKKGQATHPRITLYCTAAAFVIALVFVGPSGFRIRGGAPLFNYFLTGIGALGAYLATWVRRRMA